MQWKKSCVGSFRRDIRDMMSRPDNRDMDLSCARRRNGRGRQNQWSSPRDGIFAHHSHHTAANLTWERIWAIDEAVGMARSDAGGGQAEFLFREAEARLQEAGAHDKDVARGRRGRRIRWRHTRRILLALISEDEDDEKRKTKSETRRCAQSPLGAPVLTSRFLRTRKYSARTQSSVIGRLRHHGLSPSRSP